jgi:aryl-alcohol dehydrogenase-like predicted oxidoreductase
MGVGHGKAASFGLPAVEPRSDFATTSAGGMMSTHDTVPLILGGHTFISQLGNEPQPSDAEQMAIVEACLDNGVRMFDTTFRPEREGLGRALKALGRRDEATIIGWNFFEDVGTGPNDSLDRGGAYVPGRIEDMLSELQTDRIDYLVIHELDGGANEEVEQAQEAVAIQYQEKGLVGKLGVWEPGPQLIEKYGRENPYDFMMSPFNVWSVLHNESAFVASKELGWETLAVSPYIRGWGLDKMVLAAGTLEPDANESDLRARLADLMLRFSLGHPKVDAVTIAMRRVDWVSRNVESAEKGALSDTERTWLDKVIQQIPDEK